jgi:hypothetical protein
MVIVVILVILIKSMKYMKGLMFYIKRSSLKKIKIKLKLNKNGLD